MGVITLTISDEAETKLREMAKKNLRQMGKQVEYLIIKEDNEKVNKHA